MNTESAMGRPCSLHGKADLEQPGRQRLYPICLSRLALAGRDGMAGKLASQVRGLSEAQFRETYGTEEQCRAVVEKLPWPSGFVCPVCGGCERTRLSTRPKIQCRACRHQVSLTSGTIFPTTKLPLTSWFPAMWLITTAKRL